LQLAGIKKAALFPEAAFVSATVEMALAVTFLLAGHDRFGGVD
jgi:hypothetical protein